MANVRVTKTATTIILEMNDAEAAVVLGIVGMASMDHDVPEEIQDAMRSIRKALDVVDKRMTDFGAKGDRFAHVVAHDG